MSDPRASFDRRAFLRLAAGSVAASSAVRRAAAEAPALPATIEERMRAALSAAPLSMRFDGSTADDARQWQAAFGARLRTLLGSFDPPSHWDCVLERRVELSDHIREERLLVADGVDPVPFHLLLPPLAANEPRPAVIAVHGHCQFAHDGIAGIDDTPERQAEIEKCRWDYGRKLVERGYVVAA
ncbi:MAG TPA: hypothetical protein VG713_06505, partial [Pirellulales bacterium]|nr:hypothetical protein [Pirellulales bacterium]